MSVRATIQQARTFGSILGEREARIAPSPGHADGSRAWFGTDSQERPVAYFEIGDQALSPFAVSQVIDVAPVETVIEGQPEDVRAAKVTCRDSRLDDVFIAFMDDVTSQLGERSAVDVLLNSAAEWRNLLRVVKHGLSDSAAAGLYGELRFLEELVHHCGAQVIETWQRDGQDVHDFIADRIRVEVKTSSFQNRQAVSIHGLKQLEVPVTAPLILAVAEIEKHGDGETIDSVVDRILDAGVPIDSFSQKLEAAGFVRGMSSLDDGLTFSLVSWRYWEIARQSPVLSTHTVGSEVATAISDVQYTLNLAALAGGTPEFDWTAFRSGSNL
ncbi:PD-(D/E)XK motif protein [Brevibacterium jeotgali]|uniref:PD-(D/E)XK family member, (DUF4420) n=1 Tax=Brevibacterium jeotgali TaxID=1262550 RepID=A0A2H1L3F7_9MICO|nr:PD-(D/E)XK motif protein [Brevibacterium jeotgali]TWC01671.1 putative PD-(D/E)XK family protein DUF4420 [Brevibacterium jeotgali]SMY11416.1 Putative PD-(D/E)XK family member, (DUF4420) [Brevibacterium jeotgali]